LQFYQFIETVSHTGMKESITALESGKQDRSFEETGLLEVCVLPSTGVLLFTLDP
jgi:hypothetical protein